MTPGILALVLCAAVFHAVWNILAKSAEGYGRVFVWSYGLVEAIVLAPIALWIIARDPSTVSWALAGAGIITGLLHIGYGLSLQTGYAKADLSIVYPLARGSGPVITMICAIALLGERPSAVEVWGAVAVVAGIAIVTARKPGGGASIRDGVFWGLLTGAFIAGYTLFDAHAVTTWTTSPIVYFWFSSIVQAALLSPSAIRRRTIARQLLRLHWGVVIAVGVLSAASYVMILFAMQAAPVSLVAPLRESSVVIGLILARVLFGERSLGVRMLGALVVVAGIGLIAAG